MKKYLGSFFSSLFAIALGIGLSSSSVYEREPQRWQEPVEPLSFTDGVVTLGRYPQTLTDLEPNTVKSQGTLDDETGWYTYNQKQYAISPVKIDSEYASAAKWNDGSNASNLDNVEKVFLVEPIKWEVLSSSGSCVDIISTRIIERWQFTWSGDNVEFKRSDLYKFLTGDFFKRAFDDTDKSYLQSYDGMYDSSFVDLGLPSGTLWAKTNICTKWETSYGGYYMWGQTNRYIEPDDAFYRKMSNENFDKIQPEDDIVYTLMGRKWRLPTAEEFNELFVFTDHKFVKNYNATGVNGMLFTSKLDSTKQIFLPAGGYINDVGLCDVGVMGAYLTSSKNSLNAMVYAAFDVNGGVNTWQGFYKYKYLVRGVTNK